MGGLLLSYNFEVKEAVWIGAAVMSYARYVNCLSTSIEISQDMFWFKQCDICKFSQILTENTVQPVRLSQWYNGDHKNSSHNYLRANGAMRRLTARGEFTGKKEKPEDLDVNIILDLFCLGENIQITIFDLITWVNEIYSPYVFDGTMQIINVPARDGRVVQIQSNISLSPKYNIDELITKIETFYNKIFFDENARFKSWEHCYMYFQINRKIQDHVELMSLHLAFYLASWGMYRNSFLLQRDYKIHIPIIEILMERKYDPLCAVSAEQLMQSETQNLILELKERMSMAYGREITDTLTTKILLGTLGCTPAYDRFFKYGLKKYHVAPAVLNRDSLKGIASFYMINSVKLEQLRTLINSTGTLYPQMKIIDMCFWQVGFDDGMDIKLGDAE